MAVITVTADEVRPLRPHESQIVPGVAGVAITKGQAVVKGANGRYILTDETTGFDGISLKQAAAGGHIDVLQEGPCAGFDLSSETIYDALNASTTDGAIDAAGIGVKVGLVWPLGQDSGPTPAAQTLVLWVTGPTNV